MKRKNSRISVILALALVFSLLTGLTLSSSAATAPDFLFVFTEGVDAATSVDVYNDGLLRVTNGEALGFVDASGNVVIGFQYDVVNAFSGGYAAFQEDGLWGFIDVDGNVAIPASLEGESEDMYFHDGLLAYEDGYIDEDGEVALDGYSSTTAFVNGYAVAFQSGSAGLIDKKGNVVIGFEYEDISFLGEFPAAVKTGGLWGFADSKGVVIAPAYDVALGFSGGVAYATSGAYAYFIDTTNKVLARDLLDTSYFNSFVDGVGIVSRYAKAGVGDRFYYIDNSGKVIIPFDSYDRTIGNGDSLIVMQIQNNYVGGTRYGAVNYANDIVIPFNYYELGVSSEGLMVASTISGETVTKGVIANPIYVAPLANATLYIPGDVTVKNANGSLTYYVKSGDTYNNIAVNYYGKASASDRIKAANDNVTLTIGAKLTLPADGLLAPLTSNTNAKIYWVKGGDTVASIADKLGVDVKTLSSINKARIGNFLYIGQALLVP